MKANQPKRIKVWVNEYDGRTGAVWDTAGEARAAARELALAIKAKLVTVESGIETLEEAFLAHIVVPSDGRSRRFADVAIAAIARAYSSPDGLPPLLPSGGAS